MTKGCEDGLRLLGRVLPVSGEWLFGMKSFFVSRILAFSVGMMPLQAVEESELMPSQADYVSMWWQDGFPKNVEGAPWHRWVQSGSYAFVLDTEKLSIPYLGAVPSFVGEESLGSEKNPVKLGARPAELELILEVDGQRYQNSGGGKWSRHGGPRLIESGGILERADVTDLEFRAEDGSKLNVEARFETVAWSDRLGLIFWARPGKNGTGKNSSRSQWKEARMQISLKDGRGISFLHTRTLPKRKNKGEWEKVFLVIDPVEMRKSSRESVVTVAANEFATGRDCPASFEPAHASHLIQIDQVKAIPRPGSQKADNDVLERIKVVVANPSDQTEKARLVFERASGESNHSFGSWITGVTALLRDSEGNPTGIPVQLSKNWHRDREAGPYQGSWFHAITQLNLPPQSRYEFELTICYGHWGGLPAASHAQLSLIGWGMNQLWDQSALGSWGESICYDPDQANARCTITDVRPMMVTAMNGDKKWNWTTNVGGGDFFRLFDAEGRWVPHRAMKTMRHRVGPCLTETTYQGKIGEELAHSMTVSLGRSDDIVRGTYRIRLQALEAVDFSRLVFFQAGADTYLSSRESRFAVGNEEGVSKEWQATWGGDLNRTEPLECEGEVAWISMHEAEAKKNEKGAVANRGLVIREWKARLGGKKAAPWVVERGAKKGGGAGSTIDLVPPPGVTRLQKGDFVEATIEHLVIPQFTKDYYGPNQELREALKDKGNTWRMVEREAVGNDRKVECKVGNLERRFPDMRVQTKGDQAELTLEKGLGFVPVTFVGLSSFDGFELFVDGKKFDQAVHGSDFWQADFDVKTETWSRTYNLPLSQKLMQIQLRSLRK